MVEDWVQENFILVPMLCVGTSFFLYIIALFHHLIIP